MRVNYKEFAKFMDYKKPHRLMRLNCNLYLEPMPHDNTRARAVIKWPTYLFLFIPVHIIAFFAYAWDGGIKNFTVEGRTVVNKVIPRKWE